MNHKLILGIAVFLAIVGLAVIGGDKQAQAGLGSHGASCSGCDGESDCSGKDCDGSRGGRLSGLLSRGCSGRKGLSLNLRDLLGGGCDGCDGCDFPLRFPGRICRHAPRPPRLRPAGHSPT